jgi:hypothetical protein
MLVDFGEHPCNPASVARLLAISPFKVECSHVNEIHEPSQVILKADRDLNRRAVVLQLLADLIDDAPGRRARAIALVDESKARHVVSPHLAVDGDSLRLYAT